MSVDTMVDYY